MPKHYRAGRTLRFRLAFWSAVLVATTAAITISVVHQATRWSMIQNLDASLREDSEEIRLALDDLDYRSEQFQQEFNRKAIGHRRLDWFCKLFNENGELLWGSINAPERMIAPLAKPHLELVTVDNYRYLTIRVKADPPPYWLRVGASIEPMLSELGQIDRVALMTGLISLLIAPVLGWVVSGRELDPLREMVETAATINPTILSQRLAIRGAHSELDQLALTINSLLDRIGSYVDEKRDFLANAAHELRTPLAAIRATADVALVSSRTEDEYRELVVQIMEQTDSLSAIVNQLLLLSESTFPESSSNFKAFAFDEIITKSVDIFRAVAENNNVYLHIKTNSTIILVGNRDQWIQVMNNLIDNAIKYTPSGGSVEIESTLITSTGGDDTVRLIVRDTGIGIDAAEVQRIFNRFYRADRSRTRLIEVSGTGLGLSICKAVVEGHRGTIRCESQPSQGTSFIIEVPRPKITESNGCHRPVPKASA